MYRKRQAVTASSDELGGKTAREDVIGNPPRKSKKCKMQDENGDPQQQKDILAESLWRSWYQEPEPAEVHEAVQNLIIAEGLDAPFDPSQARGEDKEVFEQEERDDETWVDNVVEPPPVHLMARVPKMINPLEIDVTSGPAASKTLQIGVDLQDLKVAILLIYAKEARRLWLRITQEELLVLIKEDVFHNVSEALKSPGPKFVCNIGGLRLEVDEYKNLRINRPGFEKINFVISPKTWERLGERRDLIKAALRVVKQNCSEVARLYEAADLPSLLGADAVKEFTALQILQKARNQK